MLIKRSLQMQQKIPAGKSNQATSKPVLLDAIDSTVRTIENRARLYRNLVVAISAVPVLSIFFLVLFRHWIALAGLVILVPLTGAFLFFDSRLVRRWRAGIVEMARFRDLDEGNFVKTISAFRHLPPNALKAMLLTIPSEESQQETPVLGQTIVDSGIDALARKNELKILRFSGLLTIALLCLIAGAFYGSVALLASGGSLIILLLAFGRR
jgi:hypothetical protein